MSELEHLIAGARVSRVLCPFAWGLENLKTMAVPSPGSFCDHNEQRTPSTHDKPVAEGRKGKRRGEERKGNTFAFFKLLRQ